jgi:hypothetical protein
VYVSGESRFAYLGGQIGANGCVSKQHKLVDKLSLCVFFITSTNVEFGDFLCWCEQ